MKQRQCCPMLARFLIDTACAKNGCDIYHLAKITAIAEKTLRYCYQGYRKLNQVEIDILKDAAEL